jgi:N-acetylmuramoyl-L-alanine amidase
MMLTRSSGRVILALLLFILAFFVSSEAIYSRQWETDKAAQAYQYAQQNKNSLDTQSPLSQTQLLKSAQAYRKVYLLDPHYRFSGEAIYEEAMLYQQLGEKFGDIEYYRTAIKRFTLLVNDYEGNRNCADALLRMAAIYSNSLKDDSSAQKAYQRLQTRYKYSAASIQRAQTDAAKQSLTADKSPVPIPPKDTPSTSATSSQVIVKSVRYTIADDSIQATIDLEAIAQYKHEQLQNPDRIYFDIFNAKLGSDLGRMITINDTDLNKIRISQKDPNTVRIVFDTSRSSAPTISELHDPFTIVIHFFRKKPSPNLKPLAKDITPNVADAPSASTTKDPSVARSNSPQNIAPVNKDTNPNVADAPSISTTKDSSIARSKPPKNIAAPKENTLIPPKPVPSTSHGDRTLTRMLGLKIGRIVLDPGHGGHDQGTTGPKGLWEKDLVLSLAQELQKMLQTELGADVILTRNDDTYIPLEERTAIANQHHADLFISIHANSSPVRSTSGVETYYLDFAKTNAEREIAARENATASKSISDLEDLIKKIAKADKSAESRELASIIQNKLYSSAAKLFPSTHNRGVRSAPFIVLIGANMPSVLAEVAFISNPRDERLLNKTINRKVLAKALYSGIVGYMETLGSDRAYNQTIAK